MKMNKLINLISVASIVAMMVLISPNRATAATDTINLTANVSVALTLGISSGTYAFGSLTPGTPVKGSGGIDISVETSASNGYNLLAHDAVAGSDSALLHTDTTTHIADFPSLFASPTIWNPGTSTGLGLTVFDADTTKEVKWGSGTTYNDANNAYAGVPQSATAIHTSAGYKANADITSISFILDVPASQKTGSYSGNVVITATAVLE